MTVSRDLKFQVGSAHHIPALDGLRGVAIILVMIFHMTLLGAGSESGLHYCCALDRIWANFGLFGWIGVDLFFVLSGFLITGLLWDAKGCSGYFRNFYVRRTLRIFPLYYLVVTFSLLVLPHIPNAKSVKFGRIAGDEIWYWTYLSNYIIAQKHFRHGILDVSWTLAIEEQFYLLWPLVVLVSSRRVLLMICSGMILTAIALRSFLFFHGVHPIAIMVTTPCRMDALAAGAAVALIARGPNGLSAAAFRMARWIAVVASGALLGYLFIQGPSWDNGPLGQSLGYSIIAVFFAAILCLSLNLRKTNFSFRLLNTRSLRQIGRFSYAIYLFNFPVRALVRDMIFPPQRFFVVLGSQLPAQMLFYVLAMSITILLAWLSWHLFESKFLRLKRFFPMPSRRVENSNPQLTVRSES